MEDIQERYIADKTRKGDLPELSFAAGLMMAEGTQEVALGMTDAIGWE